MYVFSIDCKNSIEISFVNQKTLILNKASVFDIEGKNKFLMFFFNLSVVVINLNKDSYFMKKYSNFITDVIIKKWKLNKKL